MDRERDNRRGPEPDPTLSDETPALRPPLTASGSVSDPLVDDPEDEAPEAAGALEVLRIFERVSELGTGDPESDSVLTEVASELAARTRSEKCVISLVDPASKTLETKATHGFGAEPPSELSYIQDGIHGWVLRIGTPMVLSNIESHGGLPLLPFERTVLLAAPLSVGETKVGAVSVLRAASDEGFHEEDMLFVTALANLLAGMIGQKRAEEQGRDAIRKAIESLTLALDARDPYTRGHSQRVAMYSLAIANELETADRYAFAKDMRNSLLMSALLHDIGKIGIRDEILLKPSKLTDEEYGLIKTHPEKGAEIVRMIPGFDENVIAGILQHHERWDGKGYPCGTQGDKIHVFGRIIGLADAFDAIVTSRPYHTAASFSYAMNRVEELSGTAFDPEVVRGMTRALKDQNVWNELGAISTERPASKSTVVEAQESGIADRTLRRIFGRHVNDLPTLPHVVSQVLGKTRNQNTSLDEVVNLISTDQALVSTYLRLVNSAFYGFSRRITTLKQAITLLGFRSVRNVVVNAGVVGIFRKRTFNNRYRHRLWDHSVACAVAARLLAERQRYQAKEEAFTAGLLHDIGKVVIDQYAPKDSAAIMRRVEAGIEPRAAEEEVLGCDHTKIGSWIAERWHLPKTLCSVIEHHHEPLAPDIPGDPELVRLVAAANGICKIRRSEDPDTVGRAVEAYVASSMNLFQLDASATTSLLGAIWTQKAEAMKTFGGAFPSDVAEAKEEEASVPSGGESG